MKFYKEIKVYYHDTDAYNITWHGNYLKWYEHRKNEVCTRLLTIRNNCPDDTYSKWLLDAINFIQEDKI